MNRRNKVPPHHLPSRYTQQLSPCRAVVGQSLVPPGTYQLQGVPSALSITGGRGHQELNGILYTLCWSNLPVNTFWVPPSRLLTDKQDPLRATVWSRTAWMQRLGLDAETHCRKSAGSESGPTEICVTKATLGLQRPAALISCSTLSPRPFHFLGHAASPDTRCSTSAGSSHAVTKSYMKPNLFQ